MFGVTLVCRELEEKLVSVTAFLSIFYDDDDDDDDDDLLQRGVQQLLSPLSVFLSFKMLRKWLFNKCTSFNM